MAAKTLGAVVGNGVETRNSHIYGLILASGLSSRMGKNKLLLPWPADSLSKKAQRPLLQYVVDAAKQSFLDKILVILPEQGTESGDALRSQVDFSGCTVLENPLRALGQAEALKTGIQHVVMHSSPQIQGAMILLGDQPFLTAETLNTLIVTAKGQPQSWIIPCKQSESEQEPQRGNPVIIPSVEFSRVLQLEGDTGARVLLKSSLFCQKFVPLQEQGPFIDIDTQQAYEKYSLLVK